jgi:hypothetical protein
MAHVGIGNFSMAGTMPQSPGPQGGPDVAVLGESGTGGGNTNLPGSDIPGEGGGVAGGAGSGGGGAGSGGGGGGGGSLPFTGFGVAVIGAIGAGMSAAGVALRDRLRRN